MKSKLRKIFESIYIYFMFLFLYVPIIVLMVFSFNENKSRGSWGGFSLKWYKEMFANEELMSALQTTLIVGVISAIIATIIGTAAAIGIMGFKNKKMRNIITEVTNIPMVSSELVIGVSLMLLFIFLKVPSGMFTLILSHITFCIPYVILSVTPKLIQLDKNLYEAAVDLGAKPWYAFKNVVLPEIMPGIITGLLFAFTLSIDDFVITFFVTGPGADTLPLKIYSMIKHSRQMPVINSLSTLMLVFTCVLVAASRFVSNRKQKRAPSARK